MSSPDPFAILGGYVRLVADHYERPAAEIARSLTPDQLVAEAGRLIYAWALREAESYWDAHTDPPPGGGAAGAVIRARYAQLKGAAKAEERRRLQELMEAQRLRDQSRPSS